MSTIKMQKHLQNTIEQGVCLVEGYGVEMILCFIAHDSYCRTMKEDAVDVYSIQCNRVSRFIQ